MAAVIFISAEKNRFMLPNASLMIHQPSVSDIGGNCSEISRISEELITHKNNIYQLIADHSDFTIEELNKETVNDLYFTAEEAISKRLADKVISFSDIASF